MPSLIAGKGSPTLVISDLQIPFEAQHALSFCKYVKNHFKISDDNVLCVGDETDQYFASSYKKSPNAAHTPNTELHESIDKLKQWYATFPKMKLCVSNHGIRWWNKAIEAEIPTSLLRDYKEIIQAPKDWHWKDEWIFRDQKHPFRMIHGMGYSGRIGHVNAAIDGGMSTVIGHLHAFAGVNHIVTGGLNIWAMNSGCLIDVDAYAFEYGKYSRNKPCLGVGIIINGGKTPIWIPYEN